MNEHEQAVIRAAVWLHIWLSRSRFLLKMIVPSACRENFLATVDRYNRLKAVETEQTRRKP